MRNQLIAQRYSKAFISLISVNDYKDLLDDLKALNGIFNETPDLIKVLHSVMLSRREKIEIAQKLCKATKFTELWQKMFALLIEKHRFDVVLDILTSIETNIYRQNNQVKISVEFAHEPSENTLNQVKLFLQAELKKDVILDVKVNSNLLGGFKATTASVLIDASVQNNLRRFARNLN